MNITRKSLLLLLPFLLGAVATSDLQPGIKFTDGTTDPKELICPPSGESCYPRLFAATNDFHPILPDQELPKGLHIRINVATGATEAKLNVPEADANHQAVVMVPGQEEDRLPVGAPRELPPQDQNIKPPRSGDAGEQGVFDAGVAGVLAGKPGVEELAALEELAHEAYWGVKIAETRGVVGGLAEVAGRVGQAEVVRALAARVLGSALANNPRALKGVERGVVGRLAKGLVGGEVAVLRVLFAVGKVLGKAEVRGEFLEMGGVGVLARVFAEGGERVRGRVAVVVEDAFLNGEMRVGEVVEEVGGLEALCKVFEEGVVGMVEEDQAARVLGALGRLRERVGCVQGRDFDAWVGKGGWGEEMEAVVGEWKEKFAVSAKEEL